MIENLSQYWDKADGKTKKKILGCIFKEKFEDFNFERCNHIFTPEIESIMLASKVLRKNKNKKEVKNDLLSKMAPLDGLEPINFPMGKKYNLRINCHDLPILVFSLFTDTRNLIPNIRVYFIY